MTLDTVRDYIASLGLADHVYMGKLDSKKDKSFGVYNSKYSRSYRTALGGASLQSYGAKYVTLLVHWNKFPRDTETSAKALFEVLETTRDVTINDKKIKFIQLLCNEPVNVDTDESGIYEMVIEAAIIYEKGR